MDRSTPHAYGLWSLVTIKSLVFASRARFIPPFDKKQTGNHHA